jgi:hypothetical protein
MATAGAKRISAQDAKSNSHPDLILTPSGQKGRIYAFRFADPDQKS